MKPTTISIKGNPLGLFSIASTGLAGLAIMLCVSSRNAEAQTPAAPTTPAAAAPAAMAPMTPPAPAPAPEKPYTGKPIAFAEVQPILKKYCYDCHGGTTPQATKSGLALDTAANALKGGRSKKPAITPGHINSSEVIRLISIPAGGRGHMPQAPRGQPPVSLTAEEIQKVSDWVASGASFDLPATPAPATPPAKASP